MNNRMQSISRLLKQAGEQVMKIYHSDFSHELKKDKSPITEADLLANKIIHEGLEKLFPYEIVSEETHTQITDINQPVWVLDPIDGTKDFVDKTDEFSIMLALVEQQQPVLGVVYVPALDKLYYAEKNHGAFLQVGDQNPVKLNVSKVKNIADITLVRSRNHFSEADQAVANELQIQQFIKLGSVGIKFGAIAAGQAELCFYCNGKMGIWDDAASHIILKEAGGDVFTMSGEEPRYDLNGRKMPDGFIGSNGYNKKEVLAAIAKVNSKV